MRNLVAPSRRHQRGSTLLEALFAFFVLTLGMLTVARVQTQLRLGSDLARQRSEAVRLAQEDLETLRAFAMITASAGAPSYDDIASRSRTVDPGKGDASSTRYLVTRQIDSAETPRAKNASVTVSWTDRSDTPQQVALHSIIAGADPAEGGALSLARSGTSVKGAFGRGAAIPLAAKDLGNRSSVFKPVSSGSIAYLFDNATGLVTGRCTGISATKSTRELTASDLVACDDTVRQLLRGIVRFSSASPPDPAHGNDVPPAVAVSLALSGGTYASAPDCAVEAMKTVSYTAGASLHVDAVPLAATAVAMGLPGWTDTGERHLAYHCAVVPLATGQWSGRATLLPIGWSIGTGAADRRVCRYASDLDGSGTIDANIEHPASYAGVHGSLANQDFLVINGSESCPNAPAIRIAGHSSDVFVDRSTAQHQP